MLQCDVCYMMFKNVRSLTSHVKQEHTDQKFVLNKKVVLSGVQVDVQEENGSVENESSTLSQSNVTPQKNVLSYVCKLSVDSFITLQLHQKKDHPLHPDMWQHVQNVGWFKETSS